MIEIIKKLNQKKSRKGQMEIIGLVVIVILITLGLLFLTQFALKDGSDYNKKVFTQKGLAKSTANSLMKITITEPDCLSQEGSTVNLRLDRDLLRDCAMHYPTSLDSRYYCQQQHSCDFLEAFISEMLEQTLGTWGKRYEFTAQLNGYGQIDTLISINAGTCNNREKDSSGKIPLRAEEIGLVESELIICD